MHPVSSKAVALSLLSAILLAGCGQIGQPESLQKTIQTAKAASSVTTSQAAITTSKVSVTTSQAPVATSQAPAAATSTSSSNQPIVVSDTEQVPAGAPVETTLKVNTPVDVSDQLIVQVAPGQRVTLDVDGPRTIKDIDMGDHFQVVKLPAGMSRDQAIKLLQAKPGVKSVTTNRYYKVSDTVTPNDPDFGSQWGLKRNRADAQDAWAKGVSAANVMVAVLDTGIDYNHPELAGRVYMGPDIAGGTGDPMDHYGHGTHVAGIIGAAGNNGVGVAGVAWDVKLLAVKVLDDTGSGTTDNVATGIKYAADNGARVINLSLGTSDPTIDPVLHAAMQYAYTKGTLIIAAAGNEHAQVGSPANDPYAIAVSSTSSFWIFEWASLFSNYGDKVEVAAPGGSIESTLPSGGSTLGTGYGKLSGTSMATPFVAGEAALIFAQHPDWTPDQVRARIDQAVDHKGSSGRNQQYGYGRINLNKALD